MLESITLGDISTAVAFLVGLIGGIIALSLYAKKAAAKLVKEIVKEEIKPHLEEIHEGISSNKTQLMLLQETARETEKDNAKNYITHFLSQLDVGQNPTQSEFECFYENLRVYEKCGGDGFIHGWIDSLVGKGAFNITQKRMLQERNSSQNSQKKV